MRKTVLTFGLISGVVLSAMLLLTLPFQDDIGLGTAEIIGYTTMVAASLLIYFGGGATGTPWQGDASASDARWRSAP
jgi:hypothetical protein